jgi:large subunit ribosomal protein L24e
MKCSFSGKEIPPGTGKMYVKKDGTILWFASSKAQKNMMKLGRKANKTRWTEDASAAKKARIATLKHEKEAQVEEKKTTKAEPKAKAPQKAPAKKPAKK